MAGTRWVRLDVDYFANPKALAAGPAGRALHLASICWVARYLTDGHIPTQALASIAREAGVKARSADAVIAAGLWVPNGDGYELHDFVEMNGSRSEAEAERARWRERQARFRAKRHGDVTP